MNLNFDLSVFSRAFRGFAAELRKNRPLAGGIVVLVLALVAIPVLLSKSASPAPVPPAPLPSTAPATVATLPTLNVATSPADSRLAGPARNPFGNTTGTTSSTASSTSGSQIVATQTAVTTTPSTSSGGTTSSSTSTSNTTPSGGSSGTSSSGTSSTPASSPTPTPATPAKPKPAPSGLASNQAYDVSTAITNGNGGLNTIDPLERLSVLPSNRQPLLVELGVAQKGDHVLFVAQPNAILSGPGTCIPGPIDCEILSLGTNQTESIATGTGSATPTVVALFELTGISKQSYSSSAAADKARQAHSAVGQALLAKSNLTALSLFRYEPALGAVVDQRDLSVGG